MAKNDLRVLCHGSDVERRFTIRQVHLELTNICQLKCLMSPVNRGMTREKRLMPFSLVKSVVSRNPEVVSFGLNNWGEPLLHPDLIGIVKYLKTRGKTVYFATNAVLLAPELSKSLVDLDLDRIEFSMDSAGEEYERIRGFDYGSVKRNILEFLRISRGRVPAKIVAVVGAFNEEGVDRLRREWRGTLQVFTQPQLTFQRDNRRHPCRELWSDHLVVLSDGKVVPCCADYEGRLAVGDAHLQTLDEIANGKTMRKLRLDTRGTFCDYCSEHRTWRAEERFKTVSWRQQFGRVAKKVFA